jgi:hypothetical protein
MIGTPLQLIQYLYEQDKTKRFKIKEFKEKRNKDQNAKYWKLLSELSLKLKIGIEELHLQMLRQYSPRTQVLIPADEELWGCDYYDRKSKIKKDNKEFIVYYIYKPSHEMTTSEFALLLQGLCDECKEQDIETLSPDELKELSDLIENKKKSSN